MTSLNSEIIGFAAGTLTTLCWAPQVVKILRTRDAKAISLLTQAAFTLGCALWLIFGLSIGSASVIAFNAVTVALSALILALKLRYD